jgi:hypothetical protein
LFARHTPTTERQDGEVLSFPHLMTNDTIFKGGDVQRKRIQAAKRHVGVEREIKTSALELNGPTWGPKKGWEEIA